MDIVEQHVAATVRDLHVRVAELGLLDVEALDDEGTAAALAEIDDIKQVVDLLTHYLA
ncbi:hypothetical protein GCM10023340_07930 [Nocardioides marinquilinus]|uniref:Uncharacterized protein n=1 Tax=Nocardioides marinquilinus TaxID=1210400 RepID=A0ABP9PD54_9ACTN